MDNGFQPLDTPENVARLRGIPFMLFVGADNVVLSPAATERTYDVLCETFGVDGLGGVGENEKKVGDGEKAEGEEGGWRGDEGAENVMYRRRVIPGYGHLDGFIGRDAWRDVYPMIREEADRVVRGAGYRFVEPRDRFSTGGE